MTKEIPLTQGKVAFVDDDMFDYLMQWTWQAQPTLSDGLWYAGRRERSGKYILMHRVVAGALDDRIYVDHIDGNGMRNTRENLRVCTHAQNMHNRRKNKNNTSGFKGVFRAGWASKWRVVVRNNGKNVHVGYFNTPEAAARAYDEKAKELFGEFARTNF